MRQPYEYHGVHGCIQRTADQPDSGIVPLWFLQGIASEGTCLSGTGTDLRQLIISPFRE